jgi:hypothetical protein
MRVRESTAFDIQKLNQFRKWTISAQSLLEPTWQNPLFLIYLDRFHLFGEYK